MDAFPLVEDIMVVKNDTKLWVTIGILGILLIISTAFFFRKPTREVLHGYVQVEKRFLNVGNVVIEGTDVFYTVLEARGSTLWTKKQVSETEFLLTTELEGQVFSFAPFESPADVPSTLLWLGPTTPSAPGFPLTKDDARFWQPDATGVVWWSETPVKAQIKLIAPG